MSGWTNKGKFRNLEGRFRGAANPANYFVALVKKQGEKTLDAAAATNQGGGVVGIPVTAHGFSAGDYVRIAGTVNYNSAAGLGYIVRATTTANRIDILATFVAETFAGTETVHKGPGPRTNVFSDLAEIAAGNGYTTGGISLSLNSTDFDVLTEDDTNDKALIQIKDVVWTATGGNLPASGLGAHYAVLTDANATIANREVLHYWDLGADRTVSDTQTLTLQNAEMDLLE